MHREIYMFLYEFCYVSTYISLYVHFSGESFNSSRHNLKGVSWSPNSKGLHWLNSVALFISRILYFCGYDAFKIGPGSQLKYCLRVFPQWEQCHNWFPLFKTNKWNFIFRDRQPTHCSNERPLQQDGWDPCSWEHRASCCWGSTGREERNMPKEGRGPCEIRMIHRTTREMFISSCLRLIEKRMGDKGLRK